MKIMITGPRRPNEKKALWWARAEVIKWEDNHGHFHEHRLIRSLFVSRTHKEVSIKHGPAGPVNKHKVLLPGTMIALCRIEWVRVRLAEDARVHVWNPSDKHYQTLLLLQASPENWIDEANRRLVLPEDITDQGVIERAFTCTGGGIDLDRLREENATNWKEFFAGDENRPGFLSEPEHLSVHSSGLSLEGSVRFAWEKETEEPTRAKFIVTQPLAQARTLHMALDRERMQAEDATGDSLRPFARSFRNFAGLLQNESSVAPEEVTRQRWFGLDLTNKTGVPQFRWELDTRTAPTRPPIRLARGEVQLLVSDQPPGEQDVQPRSLLTAGPELKVEEKTKQVGGGSVRQLVLSFADGEAQTGAPGSSFKLGAEGVKEAGVVKLEEEVTLTGIVSAYDPLAAATLLRQQYRLPAPDSAEGEIEPAVLWGFVPLENGWAQLPFLNLTSQVYFDALQGRKVKAPAEPAQPLLSGAATFGNDGPGVFKPEEGEQPWNITLLNGTRYEGSWEFDQEGAGQAALWRLMKTQLVVLNPEVALNGFLWLGTQTPSTSDALPSLDNWLSGVQMLSLQTIQPDERFPSPFQLHFGAITFKNKFVNEPGSVKRKFSRPLLQNWDFSYEANETEIAKKEGEDKPLGEPDYSVLGTLLLYGIWGLKNAEKTWPKLDEKERERFDKKMETFWQSLPLVWQRHPKLPAVQALPLTQNKVPPNYPSASRQLAPFELPVKKGSDPKLQIPDGWKFGVRSASGAAAWPRLEGAKPAAADWKAQRYLWLASLGVPGLVHDPGSEDGLASDPDKFLPLQYLYGLPYTDEPNALAQLPKQEKPNHLKTPTQDVTIEKPVLPLTREAFAPFWKELSEKALLARPDADEALHKDGAGTVVRGLVEPYKWPAEVSLDVGGGYPGAIAFDGEGGELKLTGKEALRGIVGHFSDPPPGSRGLTLSQTAGSTFDITAHSMAARAGEGRQRDQRGLWRTATEPTASSKLLKTVLKHEADKEKEKKEDPDEANDRDVTLYSLLSPQPLKIDGGQSWDFWFRDVPLDVATRSFSRPFAGLNEPSALSRHAQDVNDPAATSSRYVHLSGYEWRLAVSASETKGERAPLPLLGFHFYPLTLEKVEFSSFASDVVTAVEIMGRLQLPDEKKVELPELGNAVLIRFEGPNSGALEIISIKSAAPDLTGIYGVWPLGDGKNPFAPSLRLRKLAYEPAAGFTIELDLEFYHFNTRWDAVRKEPVTFRPGEPVPIEFELEGSGNEHVFFSKAFVQLDAGLKPAEVKATVTFKWGDAEGDDASALTVIAAADISLRGPQEGGASISAWLNIKDDDDFKLAVSDTSLGEAAIQFEFSGFETKPTPPKSLYLLPGMRLSGKEDFKGFAVMAFNVVGSKDVKPAPPRLEFRYGGLETIIPCEWGESLQVVGDDLLKSVYGSSSGRVYAGYTLSGGAQGDPGQETIRWQSSLLLNGFIEVKNLISWPAQTRGLPPGVPDRVRFEFNEHEIGNVITENEGNLDKIVEALKGRPIVRVSVEGHTDNIGTPDACLRMSKRRAEAVRSKLIEKLKAAGLQDKQLNLVAVGFGSAVPVEKNLPGQGSQNNRRVEIRPAPFFFPATNPGATKPALDHTRHTIRVLLNQHEVPQDLLSGGSKQLLLNFRDNRAWQFLAVVEHQLVDVKMGPSGRVPVGLEQDRRFTVVQEVRLAEPGKFESFLEELRKGLLNEELKFEEYKTLNPTNDEISPPVPLNDNKTTAGYHHKKLLDLLLKPRQANQPNEIERLAETLIVEASASYWVLPEARQGSFTNLQYLPQATQRAILSVPGDFSMLDATASGPSQEGKEWVLLSLPFLGRLQAGEKDGLISQLKAEDSYLQVDPVHFIGVFRDVPPGTLAVVPLALSSWEGKKDREVRVSYFEQSRFRRLKRLDPVTLEENWLRLHRPTGETAADGAAVSLSSVMASLPEDSPGRLSRSAMLARLFDEFPSALTQALSKPGKPVTIPSATVSSDKNLVWRRNSLFIVQGYSDLDNDFRYYGFYFAGVQINSSGLRAKDQQPARFAAATVLPSNLSVPDCEGNARPNPEPVSLAVSPYLGMDLLDHGAVKKGELLLVFAELLCLNREGNGLSVVSSQVWTAEQLQQAGGNPEKIEVIKLWGKETASRLAADSPVAVLRVRKVREVELRNVTIEYEFQTVEQLPARAVATKAASPIRLGLELLRFAEGQFGGSVMPPQDLRAFELAPPQINGVQPIYLEPRDAKAITPEEVKTHRDFKPWTWGLSALRFSVRLTQGQVGVAAPELNGHASYVWWNVTSHHVQFVVPEGDERLLPLKFRARSIHSLLPTVPNLPLPAELKLADEQPIVGDPKLNLWQPVLPGGFNYLIVGARAGTPFVLRHFLLRQDFDAETKAKTTLASGAVPVQHRMPRPVSLPDNRPDTALADFTAKVDYLQKEALQTWPSLVELAESPLNPDGAPPPTLKRSDNPSDNALLIVGDKDAKGLDVELFKLEGGLLPQQETGEFIFNIKSHPKEDIDLWLVPDPQKPEEKGLSLELVAEGRRLAFTTPEKPNAEGRYIFRPAGASGDAAKGAALMREFLAGLPHGVELLLQMKAAPPGVKIAGYKQTLSFPLRLALPDRSRLPLKPTFVQFEDPEYNRRLTSRTAEASRVLQYVSGPTQTVKAIELTLATDRREYNPTSELLLAVSRSVGPVPGLKNYSVTLKKVDAGGVEHKLEEKKAVFKKKVPDPNDPNKEIDVETENLGELKTFDLGKFLNPPLLPGDALLISLNIEVNGAANDNLLELRVDIVSEPVTPTPEAGYALLRRRAGDNATVECVRFAWAALPQRIELVNPDDLSAGRVRRRAVYQWLDTARSGGKWEHAIQKITPAGSTHFPEAMSRKGEP